MAVAKQRGGIVKISIGTAAAKAAQRKLFDVLSLWTGLKHVEQLQCVIEHDCRYGSDKDAKGRNDAIVA